MSHRIVSMSPAPVDWFGIFADKAGGGLFVARPVVSWAVVEFLNDSTEEIFQAPCGLVAFHGEPSLDLCEDFHNFLGYSGPYDDMEAYNEVAEDWFENHHCDCEHHQQEPEKKDVN